MFGSSIDGGVATPAYGRVYNSVKEVTEAFESGKDFTLQPSGLYFSIRDMKPGEGLTIRYGKNNTKSLWYTRK